MKSKKRNAKRVASRYLIALCFAIIAMLAYSTVAFAAETVSVPVKNTGYEAQLEKTYSFNKNTKLSKSEAGVIVPLKVAQAGTIKVDMTAQKVQRTAYIDFYTDAACTKSISGFYGYLEPTDTSKTGYVSASAASTIYMKIYCSSYDSTPSFTNTIKIGLGEYTTSDKTLTSSIKYYRKNSKDIFRFRYTAPNTGKVFVKVGSAYGVYVKLEDGNKRPLNSDFAWVSNGVNLHKGRIGYAVKKGKTYYFAVKTIASDEMQTISVSGVQTVKEKSGASKKKAKKLKAKKNANGLLIAGENKADWYKIKVKKKKKVTITITGEPNTDNSYKDGIKLTVYNAKGKKIGSLNMKSEKEVGRLTYGSSYGKANKGTYYIKVSPINNKSSGYYTLKWK